MIISNDAEKAFSKIQHIFMSKNKNSKLTNKERNFLNLIKIIYKKPKANMIIMKD